MVNFKNFQDFFFGDVFLKLPTPFKRDREWFRDFVVLSQSKKSRTPLELDEEIRERIKKDDTGQYRMLKHICHIFTYMSTFKGNSQSWNESATKRRVDIINKLLDAYDMIYPFNYGKVLFTQDELKRVHEVMDHLFYDISYPVMDEPGVDVNVEIGCPGWLDLKKVILRFFSKVKLEREFDLYEEEVEGTGHIRPIRRKGESSLKGTGVFLVNLDKEKAEETVDNEKDKNSEEESKDAVK